MPLTVAGTAAERARIEAWLREICVDVSIDPKTGAVTAVGPVGGGFRTGCNCLVGLIGGRRTVTVRPLPRSTSTIPGTRPARGIDRSGGGHTVVRDVNGGTKQANGNPGRGTDGQPGSNADVYIDMSGKLPRGYRHGCPMWLVLAHELTSGHATHVVAGTAGRTRSREEYDTIVCEHAHVAGHPPLRRRDPNRTGRRLAPGAPVPAYAAPPNEGGTDSDEEGW
jgi:hypothetical protein